MRPRVSGPPPGAPTRIIVCLSIRRSGHGAPEVVAGALTGQRQQDAAVLAGVDIEHGPRLLRRPCCLMSADVTSLWPSRSTSPTPPTCRPKASDLSSALSVQQYAAVVAGIDLRVTAARRCRDDVRDAVLVGVTRRFERRCPANRRVCRRPTISGCRSRWRRHLDSSLSGPRRRFALVGAQRGRCRRCRLRPRRRGSLAIHPNCSLAVSPRHSRMTRTSSTKGLTKSASVGRSATNRGISSRIASNSRLMSSCVMSTRRLSPRAFCSHSNARSRSRLPASETAMLKCICGAFGGQQLRDFAEAARSRRRSPSSAAASCRAASRPGGCRVWPRPSPREPSRRLRDRSR